MSLTPEQLARIEQLFAEALQLSPPLRAALLAKVRIEEGDAMAGRLEVLLAAESEQTQSMLQRPARPPATLRNQLARQHIAALIHS